jgi:two-component system NtrC family response regulator
VCLDLFPHDAGAAIPRLVAAVRARKTSLAMQWGALSRSRLSARGTPSPTLFHEVYVPHLRRAGDCLARGNGAAFVAFAHGLGAQVATDGMPFAAFVAHVNLLKECCTNALADEAGTIHDAIALLDRVVTCLVGAAADGYHARRPAPTEPAPEAFHDLVGRSAVMQDVFARIGRLGRSDAPVLIVGETGTGKELIARAIHAAGSRRTGPFVAINCAALPRELIEAELFGYRRGAFSGAVSDCPGLFRAAAGGTLLLDEITEMSPELQAKLLRVLQERSVRPVGCITEQPIDVRIVASSNRDPAAALASAHLRADLYYRLSVSTIVVPPLRERREDIAPLVDHRLRLLAAGAAAPRGLTPAAVAALVTAPWPGNVRELFNVVENAYTMTGTATIDVDDLGLPRGAPTTAHAWVPVALTTFEQNERVLVERALAFTGGNKLRAARRLGISRKKLYAMIARYGLTS